MPKKMGCVSGDREMRLVTMLMVLACLVVPAVAEPAAEVAPAAADPGCVTAPAATVAIDGLELGEAPTFEAAGIPVEEGGCLPSCTDACKAERDACVAGCGGNFNCYKTCGCGQYFCMKECGCEQDPPPYPCT